MFTRIPEWATRPPVAPEMPLVEFARPKPHIRKAGMMWKCSSENTVFAYDFSPEKAYARWLRLKTHTEASNVQGAAT